MPIIQIVIILNQMVGEMGNIEGLNLFGKLTIKTQSESVEKFSAGASDGEVSLIESSKDVDVVELSTGENDQNIDENNVIIWQEEVKMQAAVNALKPQVLRDFPGEDAEDIMIILDSLNKFKTTFKENYLKENSPVGMADAFSAALLQEYETIKEEAKKNTKSAIKERVIESIIDELKKDTEDGGRMLVGIVEAGAMTLSEDIVKQITKELEKESDKFIKNYNGSNLEADLANHLKEFLSETDKDKLSGAIKKWDEDKSKVDTTDQKDKNALRQMKEYAKSFLVSALLQGIAIEIGGITVRTEVAIPQALSQFDSPEALRQAIDSAISQLSEKSRLEQIIGKKASFDNLNNIFSNKTQPSSGNFFQNK